MKRICVEKNVSRNGYFKLIPLLIAYLVAVTTGIFKQNIFWFATNAVRSVYRFESEVGYFKSTCKIDIAKTTSTIYIGMQGKIDAMQHRYTQWRHNYRKNSFPSCLLKERNGWGKWYYRKFKFLRRIHKRKSFDY